MFDDHVLSLVERNDMPHTGSIFGHQAGRDIGGVVKAVDAHLAERDLDDRKIRNV